MEAKKKSKLERERERERERGKATKSVPYFLSRSAAFTMCMKRMKRKIAKKRKREQRPQSVTKGPVLWIIESSEFLFQRLQL